MLFRSKGKEIKNYCENWVVGAKVTFYTKETEMTNMFMLMFGGDNITSDAEMNAHIAELINSIDNFDYVAYRDGTIDGEMLYIIQYIVAANNADKMLGGLVAGGGGVATEIKEALILQKILWTTIMAGMVMKLVLQAATNI